MTIQALLARLKVSLPVVATAYDEVLTQFLQTAIDKFSADIDEERDQTLVLLYAAWLWDGRKNPGLAKPPALQMAINDRAVAGSVSDG